MVLSEGTTEKISSDTTGDPGTVRLLAQCLNYYATPGLHLMKEGTQNIGHVFREGVLSCKVADKSLVLPTSRCILFDCENISLDASLVIYIYI